MSQNAIELLKADHDKVRELLSKLAGTTPRAVKSRQDLLEKIEQELTVHTRIEEEIFYPAFKERAARDQQHMYYEAVEEHRAVDSLVLPDLKKTEPDSEKFSGRAKVLKEMIEHHADEEEKVLFPAARKLLGQQDLDELGARMSERKRELLKG